MKSEPDRWNTWEEFRSAQQEIVLQAPAVAHIDVTIRYIDVGEAQRGTILLMHGIPTWGFLYHAIIPPLVRSGYRVLAPDFLGHGWSDRRDRFDRSFQDQTRMITALLDALELERVEVVGHDTGGAVALILAIEHPERVHRLVICNSVCYDRFDDDMLDFGHPLRWKPRPVAGLGAGARRDLGRRTFGPQPTHTRVPPRHHCSLDQRRGEIEPASKCVCAQCQPDHGARRSPRRYLRPDNDPVGDG